jgi:hypothetical protein
MRRKARTLRITDSPSSIENRQNPRTGDKAERDWHQCPKQDSLHMPGAVGTTVILHGAALRCEVQLPKSKSKEQNRERNEDGAVRFESTQVTDPSTSNAQAQEQEGPNATRGRTDSCQHATRKSQFRVE